MSTKIKLIEIKSIEQARVRAKARRAIANEIAAAATDSQQHENLRGILAQHDAKSADLALFRSPSQDKIQALLDDVNGKASAHTYTHPTTFVNIAVAVERDLERDGVPKAERVGTVVVARSGGPTAKAYAKKGGSSVITTTVELRRGTNAWFVTKISRSSTWAGPGAQEKIETQITPAARDAIIRKALSGYTVQTEAAQEAA